MTFVWRDPWIPAEPPRPPTECGVYCDPLLLVSQLMDPATKEWLLDKLVDLFDVNDINLIQTIRPSRIDRPDGFCWVHTKSGNYSVKSGYDLAVQLKDILEPQQILQPSVDAIKSKIWTVKTSRKIKHFAWQAVAGCIPVRTRLAERHCGTVRSCPRCGTEEETINHMLFECPTAAQTWSLSDIHTSPELFPRPSLFYNFDYLLWRAKEMGSSDTSLSYFPWILWYIWKARNDKVFNDKDVSALDILHLARAEAEAWKVAQLVTEALEETNTLAEPATEFSHVIFPRCQVDASWAYNSKLFGGGFVLDNSPDTSISGSFTEVQVAAPIHAECRSLIWAMKMTRQLGISSMRFESDCLELVRLLEDEEEWPSLASELEEFNSIRLSFISFSLVYISRSLNVRADLLSKEARVRGFLFSHVNNVVLNELVSETSSHGTFE